MYAAKDQLQIISIHAPPVGSDPLVATFVRIHIDFNPRSPCGERRRTRLRIRSKSRFQSTLPLWGATRSKRCRTTSTAFQSTLPLWGATAKMHRFLDASFAKFSGFCDFLQIGENSHSRKQSEVVVFGGKWGANLPRVSACIGFAVRESEGLPAGRCFGNRSARFSFRIDFRGSKTGGCPFPGP